MNEINEIKEKLLDMLKWFHAECETNGLKYYALGGTLLGAVRHHGFIPWDDDIDVGMPRGDYEKFKEHMKSRANGRYVFETFCGQKDFVYPYGKLYDTNTTLIEHTRYKTKRGMFLDIFPLDGIGNTREESVENYKSINSKLNLLLTKVCAIRKERKFYKNAAIVAGRLLPFRWKKLIVKIEQECAKRSFDEYNYVGNLVGNWNFKELALKEWFGDPTEYKFEDTVIFGPQDADAYLTNVYGDYMKLPPEEKQVSHHDFLYFSTEEPYLKGDEK